jgi:hypothetical protein
VSLDNLLKIGQIKSHPVDANEVERLLSAAQRNLSDARAKNISPETRFDAAYKALLQAGLAALRMHGYRPDTNRPGHHMTVLQCVPLTMGVDRRRVAVLDALRRQRNAADYTGDEVDATVTENCIVEAARLLSEVQSWRATNRPELVPPPC